MGKFFQRKLELHCSSRSKTVRLDVCYNLWLTFLFLIFCVCSCANHHSFDRKTQLSRFERLWITFDEPINGYKVEIEIINDTTIVMEPVGTYNAIVHVNKDGTCYSGMMPLYFGCEFGENDWSCSIEMRYESPSSYATDSLELRSFHNLPFFFMDIDMDNNSEFIVRGHQDGAYSCDTYHVYDLFQYNGLIEIRKDEPFNELDSRSVIDFMNRRITINQKSGIKLFPTTYELTDDKWSIKPN